MEPGYFVISNRSSLMLVIRQRPDNHEGVFTFDLAHPGRE